ncbi:hypothetical protein [Paenibacillus sp. RC67]|uniref:hypothetical protein n=1 Tax=Paenibacillus sp. RC67 TaxID=3039392 RepID=UPI0024AE867C|nr:hypothetical protein [Paenibacillus sp. RC67]
MMRQVLIIFFAVALLVSGCTTKPADQAAQPDASKQQQTPSPSPSASPDPNGTDAAKGDQTNTTKPTDQNANKATPAPVEAPKGAKEQPIVTSDQYGKVDFGMTFDEVSKNMGQMGKLISEFKEEDGSNPVVTYEYQLKDGGSVKVTFRNGKVTSKSDSTGPKK